MFMWVSHRYRLDSLCLLLLVSYFALPQMVSADESATLNLEKAVQRTLERNPSLIAFGYQIAAQKGRVTQSQLRPNIELGLEVENVAGSGAFEGIDSVETTLSLGWVLERGKRERRVAAARAGVSLFESVAEIQRMDVVAETARLLLESLANQERLVRTQEAVTLAEQTVAAVRERVQAGRTPEADLARAEASLARMELAREDVEHELVTSNHWLAAQWGDTQPDFAGVSGNILALPTPGDFQSLLARIEQNPDLSRYLTEQRLREAELRLAQANAKPNWRISAGIRRLERSDDQAFVAGITIPLAMRNRNQGRVAGARARLSQTDADRRATRVQIETQLFALYQGLQHSLHRTTALRDAVLPRVEQALADTQRAFASGRYGYFELQQVQAEVLDARTALVEASIDAHEHVIEIERLTGTAMLSLSAHP
ncbi:MAG: TolC family protein [bacterium]